MSLRPNVPKIVESTWGLIEELREARANYKFFYRIINSSYLSMYLPNHRTILVDFR